MVHKAAPAVPAQGPKALALVISDRRVECVGIEMHDLTLQHRRVEALDLVARHGRIPDDVETASLVLETKNACGWAPIMQLGYIAR